MSLITLLNIGIQREGRYLLKDINLEVGRGEVLALIGPTGAGKTTLLRVVDLLEAPTSGKIFFDGELITNSPTLRLKTRRRMAFVLQKPIVFNMSVYENIACTLHWHGLNKRCISEKVHDALKMVNLLDYQHRNARTLSGGEMQRVAIARAIAVEPEILLMDEPSANLDPITAAKIEGLMEEIIKVKGLTVLMSTHDMSQGQRMAENIAVLLNGELVQHGGSRDIFTSPINGEVAEFVGMENILDGIVTSKESQGLTVIDINGKSIEAITNFTIGESVFVCIRPEDVTLALARPASSARNALQGIVSRIIVSGALCRVEVDCGFPLVAFITRRSSQELALEKAKPVYAIFKATTIHIIKR
jgi:tungstate transport system ATP-binding protein